MPHVPAVLPSTMYARRLRKPARSTGVKAGRVCGAALAAVALSLAGAAPVSAHNHVFNPSGDCNNSRQGASPGNSGETLLNPGGKSVGKAKADIARGGDHCNSPRRR